MAQIEKTTLQFFSDLKKHNEKEWFAANRKRYESARDNFEGFVQDLINEISRFDPTLKDLGVKSCTYRINRDIRFSNDKSLYKTHLGAFIVKGGKRNGDKYAGYYFHIEPGGSSMIAGGAYMPPMPWLTAIREKINLEGDKFLRIINNKEFVKFFGSVSGDKLKSAPKGYASDNKYIEYLKLKTFLVSRNFTDKEVLSDACFKLALDGARLMKPLNEFMNDYIL